MVPPIVQRHVSWVSHSKLPGVCVVSSSDDVFDELATCPGCTLPLCGKIQMYAKKVDLVSFS